MAAKKSDLLSAQITVRPASGRSFDTGTAITSANISEYLPSPAAMSAAREAFAQAGLEVSNPAGMSFSITAPAHIFEKLFNVTLRPGDRGGLTVVSGDGRNLAQNLPVESLPKALQQHVVAATFSTPPDFGPQNF
jgi:hypothetical protein